MQAADRDNPVASDAGAVGDLTRRLFAFGESSQEFARISGAYAQLGLAPGSAILVLAPNTQEFLLHWIAILSGGYVPCAAAPSTKAAQVSTLRRSLNIAAVAAPHLEAGRHDPGRRARAGSFDLLVYDPVPPSYEPFDVLILTTGTSGAQTACVHTVESLVRNAAMTNEALNITAADRQLVVLPMYHTYALVTQSIGSIISGCELIIDGPPFTPGRYADLIRGSKVSICCITPTIARELLGSGAVLPPVRSISIGGDCVAADDVARLLAKPFVNELYITYGLTEAGPRVSVLPAHEAPARALGTVGKPFPGVSVKIASPDARGVGQLLVKTPSMCRRKVGANVQRQPFTETGYLETGDLFSQDADGYLRYVARQADIVIVEGEKVNTRSIDSVAATHPDVEFARTVAGNSESLVMRVWAKDDKPLDLKEIEKFMRSMLRLHEVPGEIVQERIAVFHK